MQGLRLPAELLAVHMHLAWVRCQVPQVQVWARLPAVGEGPLLSHLPRHMSTIRVAGPLHAMSAQRHVSTIRVAGPLYGRLAQRYVSTIRVAGPLEYVLT